MSTRKIKAYYQAIVHEFEDGGIRLLFERIESDGNTTRLYEIGESTLHEAFQILGQDILDGHVFPDGLEEPYFVDGMIASHDDFGLFVRIQHAGSAQHSWQSVSGSEGLRPDEQVHEWIDSETANITFDPRSDA